MCFGPLYFISPVVGSFIFFESIVGFCVGEFWQGTSVCFISILSIIANLM